MSKPSLFVGSSIEGLPIAQAIAHLLAPDADVTIWNREHFSVGASTLDSLMAVLNDTDFAVFVLTPDDTIVARDNVFLELGLFIGRLGRQRTFILIDDKSQGSIPTDLAGITIASFATSAPLQNLEEALTPACGRIRLALESHLPEPEPTPEYYSCFISYSAHDAPFAERLYQDCRK